MIARIIILTLLSLVSVTIVQSSAYGQVLSLISVADPIRISGVPGSNVSASFVVHVSNASRPLSIVSMSPTMIQDSAGHQIPASSITLAPSTVPIRVDGVLSLMVTISIPAEAVPGNYSGRVLLFAENGSVTSPGLRLTVMAPFAAYEISYALIVVGVVLSFVYSPLGDKKPDNDKVSQLTWAQVAWTGLDWDKARNHGVLAVTAAILSAVAFAYFLTSSTDFWAVPFRDGAAAFLQGFLVHRGLDGLAPKIFK